LFRIELKTIAPLIVVTFGEEEERVRR